MKTLRKIILAGTILLGSLAHIKAEEPFSTHFYNFNKEICERMDNPCCLDSNLIIKAQELELIVLKAQLPQEQAAN